MAEAEELEAVERERARRRMLATQNNKSGKAIAAVATFPPQKQGVEIFPHPDAGKTRDKVAAAVGLGSGRTYDKAAKVWEAAKKGDETAKKLVEELDAGKTAESGSRKGQPTNRECGQRFHNLGNRRVVGGKL